VCRRFGVGRINEMEDEHEESRHEIKGDGLERNDQKLTEEGI
jgi:hypothetical protein